MHNSKRISIEQLRSVLKKLKSEAEYLYRYGDITFDKQFLNMPSADQLMLLYIAITEGDRDAKTVAHELKNRANIIFSDIEELRSRLHKEDLKKLNDSQQKNPKNYEKELSKEATERIRAELSKACQKIGCLDIEDAYWVLIPEIYGREALWIEASGNYKGDVKFLFSDHVYYNLEGEELYWLIERMKESLYVLHLHNHPTGNKISPSTEDRSFSEHWKDKDPLFKAGMMKFFIIQENVALEYTKLETQRWLGCLNQNMIEGKEHYTFDNGCKFIGQWLNGKMHGNGKYLFSQRKIYEGDFVNGKAEGKGILYDTKYVYEGDFKNDRFHRQGTITYSNNWFYIGQWNNGMREGYGKEVKKGSVTLK